MQFCALHRKDNDKLECVHGIGPQGSQGLERVMKEKRVRAGFVQSEDKVLEGVLYLQQSVGRVEKRQNQTLPRCTQDQNKRKWTQIVMQKILTEYKVRSDGTVEWAQGRC